MNALCLPGIFKRGGVLLLVAGALLIAPAGNLRAQTADEATTREALAAAQLWLAQIDAGKYEEAYAQGCTAFHNKVSEDQWITVLKAVHPNIGTMTSRKEISLNYFPDGYEGLEGECVLIKYDANFSRLGPYLEAVVLKRVDGKWLGGGYNAQPVAQDQPADAPPVSSSQ